MRFDLNLGNDFIVCGTKQMLHETSRGTYLFAERKLLKGCAQSGLACVGFFLFTLVDF